MTKPSRTLPAFAVVFVLTAMGLRVADAVPRAVTGLPRGVQRLASVDELAARQQVPFVLPSYFPSHLEWPPRQITVAGRSNRAVTVRLRGGGHPWLTLASGATAEELAASGLLPPSTLLQQTDASVTGTPALVQRIQDGNGAVWHQVAWQVQGRAHVVRYRGPLDELLRIAASYQTRNTR